jgi:hypothetical protein
MDPRNKLHLGAVLRLQLVHQAVSNSKLSTRKFCLLPSAECHHDYCHQIEYPAGAAQVASATAIVSAWTSKPKNRNFSLMTGSSACGSGQRSSNSA